MKRLTKDPMNLIIAGVGGQGNLTVSRILGNTLVADGYRVTVGETYGASQRGGAVMSHVRISEDIQASPIIPDGGADVILGMEPVEAARMFAQFGNRDVLTIVNPRSIYPIDVTRGAASYPDLDELLGVIRRLSAKTWIVNATEEAQKRGKPILANMILIGALIGSGTFPVRQDLVEEVVRESFPDALEDNMWALQRGMELIG